MIGNKRKNETKMDKEGPGKRIWRALIPLCVRVARSLEH